MRYATVIQAAFQHAGLDIATHHGFIVAPFCWENDFPAYNQTDVYTTRRQVVPITDAEATYVEQRGRDALEDATALPRRASLKGRHDKTLRVLF